MFPYNGGVGVSLRDWTERHRAEEELREIQARLDSFADSVPACMFYQMVVEGEFEDRRLVYVSKSCENLTGIPAEEAQANSNLLYALVPPEYRAQMDLKSREVYPKREMFDMEIQLRHAKTGEMRWHRLIVTPRWLSDGRIVGDGIQIDITDHKRAEEHLRLLVNELNHRVKNTLVTVQSLAAQSFRHLTTERNEELLAVRGAFEARLFALARGHDVLTRENWESASLTEIVCQALAPYQAHPNDVGRIEIEGEDLRVSPPMALSLSMALHELCTNAVKYGALSCPYGKIRVHWSVSAHSTGPHLVMRWEEREGPPVSPPVRKGFGSRLIKDGVARELNGAVNLAFEPEGVVCTLDVPLS